MKRLPILFSLLALILLSASIAYWVLQLYKPAQRPLAPVTVAAQAEPAPDAAATLFGGQALAAVATSYQLTGVVAAGRNSAAILVADGQTPQAVKLGKEIASGVTVKEVHPKYVMLSEGGVLKRIELATDNKAGTNVALAAPVANQNQYQQQQPPQLQQQSSESPAGNVPVPPNQPMEVPSGQPPGIPPPPQQPVQMPPPTRTMSGQGGQPPTQ